MSFFVRSTPIPKPKTKNIRPVSLFFAGLLVIMVVGQLFTFEEFPLVIRQMGVTDSEAFSLVRAALIVVLEVAALPFLLGMRLSPAARVISMFAGWSVAAAWFATSLWINLMIDSEVNSGLLGATVPLLSGWWMVFFTLGLGILAGWVSWGMWPLNQKRQK